MSLSINRTPIQGTLVDPEYGFFECSHSHQIIQGCVRSGFWAWVMHILGQNVRLDTEVGAIYVPLFEARRVIRVLTGAQGPAEGIGQAFARALQENIDVAFRAKRELIDRYYSGEVDLNAAIPPQFAGDSEIQAIHQEAQIGRALAEFRLELDRNPYTAIPAGYTNVRIFVQEAVRRRTAAAIAAARGTEKLIEMPSEPAGPRFEPLSFPAAAAIAAARGTEKLIEKPSEPAGPRFEPLSFPAVTAFLGRDTIVPHLQQKGLNGSRPMLDVILQAHHTGFPVGIEGGKGANEEFVKQFQYVLFKIVTEDDARRQIELLKKLTDGLKHCVPAAQRAVESMYRTFVGLRPDSFEVQFESFLFVQKDQAIYRVLDRMYPEFKTIGYQPSDPQQQQSHIRNGFIRLHGGDIGFKVQEAESDRDANIQAAEQRGAEFKRYLQQEYSVPILIREFVRQVNGSADGAWSREINNASFFKWCGDNELNRDAFFYDAGNVYPEYSPPPDARHTGLSAAYITEETALLTFRRLGYVR